MADDSASNDANKNAITVFSRLGKPGAGQPDEPITIDLTAIASRIEPLEEKSSTQSSQSEVRWQDFSPLAASLVAAALIGAVTGAAATFGLVRQPVSAAAVAEETHALKATVAELTSELAAFKANAEAATRASAQQLNRIGERLDRAEKAQAEPATRFARISESLDRPERRATPGASLPPPDVTGSVTSMEKTQGRPPSVEGWKLRDFYAGRALLESRTGTLYEVGPGATIPGLGRIETIKRVDGKVVVTTPKGIITSSLEPPRRMPYYPPGY